MKCNARPDSVSCENDAIVAIQLRPVMETIRAGLATALCGDCLESQLPNLVRSFAVVNGLVLPASEEERYARQTIADLLQQVQS